MYIVHRNGKQDLFRGGGFGWFWLASTSRRPPYHRILFEFMVL